MVDLNIDKCRIGNTWLVEMEAFKVSGYTLVLRKDFKGRNSSEELSLWQDGPELTNNF